MSTPHQHCELVGLHDLAHRLGVTRQTARVWRTRDRLPPPTAIVSGIPVWCWPTIEEWAHETGRLEHQP